MIKLTIIKQIYLVLLYFIDFCLNIILVIKDKINRQNNIQIIEYYNPIKIKPSVYKSINSSSLQILN